MKQSVGRVGFALAASMLFAGTACQSNEQSKDSGADTSSKIDFSSNASPKDIGEVLAEVNGMPVGTKEFDRAYARSMPRRMQDESQDEASKKKEVLDRLVADKLLYQEALRQGLDRDPKIQRMMINTLLRKDVYGTLRNSDISDAELEAYFEEHREEFVVPEKVQVKRILIRADGYLSDEEARKKIDNIHKELSKAPDSFKDWAVKESQDPFARRGGDVGFISKAGKPGLDSKVVDEAFKLEAGQISAVFKTDEGYNVIQVVNRRERVERSFEQMKGAVLRRVKTEKSRSLQEKYIDDLKKDAKIVQNDAKLKSHTPENQPPPRMFPGASGNPTRMNPPGMKRPPAKAPVKGGASEK